MGKSIRLKNDTYFDDSSVIHSNTANGKRTLNNYLGNCKEIMKLFSTLGSNPNFNNHTSIGIYPFYDGNFNMVDGTSDTIQWGLLIVLPYSPDWKMQIAIGGADFNQTNNCKFFVRRINYGSSSTLWNKLL